MKTESEKLHGFTLVELTIVLVLAGIVMTMGLGMVTATLENAAYSETKAKQAQIKTSLLGYLRTNGHLPCPTVPSSTGGLVSGTAALSCTGSESDGYGVVPWITLGLPRESVIDGWGSYFTYKVAKRWTAKSSPANDFTINELTKPTAALTIQGVNAEGAALETTTTEAVVVIVSHGKNGHGAQTQKVVARLPVTDAGLGEAANADVNTTTFILRPVTIDPAAFNGAYDDLVTYLKAQDLLQPLVSEGTLKSCVAYCPSSAVSSCTVQSEKCSCPSGAGVAGTAIDCTGSCTTCATQVIGAECAPVGPIPVGAIPLKCT
jgi:prepilin-type N-terminal cleavage/methylation domain-containing protein